MALIGPAARQCRRLAAEDGGATVIEYAILVTLISMVIGFFLPDLGTLVDSFFTHAATDLSNAANGIH